MDSNANKGKIAGARVRRLLNKARVQIATAEATGLLKQALETAVMGASEVAALVCNHSRRKTVNLKDAKYATLTLFHRTVY